MRNAVITSAGCISVAGGSSAELAEALKKGELLSTDITAFEPAPGEPTKACEISEFDLKEHVPSVRGYIDRTSALALASTRLALESAGLLEESRTEGDEVGLIYGTQWGCLDSMELYYAKLKSGNPRFAPPLPFSHSYANSPASVLAIELKLRGYHLVHSTGRTSGAWTLASALDAVGLGRADRIVCAASDSMSHAVYSHLHSIEFLLPDDATDAGPGDRRFLLGEGGASIVVESEESARGRGATALARLLAVGTCADEDPVRAVEDAARQAILLGGIAPGDVTSAAGTSASAAGRQTEIKGLAAAIEVAEADASGKLRSLGAVLGETMAASATLAVAAVCGGDIDGPTLVLCADENALRPSAVVALIAPV